MTRANALVLILAAALPASAAASRGGHWPQFHGPNRDNVSAETGLLKQWPKDGPRLLWKFAECGRGYAGVAVVDGRIFTSGDFGDTELVLALDLDGKLLWKTPNGKSWRGSTPGSRATPTWCDGTLYHMNPLGRLAALDAATGKELWAVDLMKDFRARLSTWAYGENVLVEGNLVLCAPGGELGRVVALDKATGKTVWANTEIQDGVSYGSAIVVAHNGVRQLIALLQKTVVGVDVATGKLLWTHGHRNPYNQNSTRPVFHDGHVFVTSGHKAGGRLLRLSPKSDAVKEVWFSEEFDNCHGGVLVLGDRLYGSGCRLYHKGLLCVEFATGKTVYRAEALGKVSTTWAEGLLYCIDQDGMTSLVNAGPQEAGIISRFKIPWEAKDQSLAHPVVCGGRLYLRHDKNLFAYDVSAESE